MIKQFKEKIKKFWKWIVALILGGTILAVGISLQPNEIPFVIANGERIEFPYTDENSNENLIIYTDKEIYNPLWAWNGFDVYVAVENKSGESQPISFQSFFSKDFSIEEVAILNPNATTTIKEPIYEDICETTATSTNCSQQKTGEKDKVVLGVWNTIPQQQFSKEEYDKTISDNKIQVKQKIGNKVEGNFIDYSLKNQFSYYKLKVKSNEPFSKEEFFIEVIGQKAAYGLLDPTILTADFNSYTDGDLNGQGSWTGNATFDIQGTTVYEGAKAVYWSGSVTDVVASSTGTLTNDGRITFYARVEQKNKRAVFMLYEGATFIQGVYFTEADNIAWYSSDVTILAAYASSTWYQIELEWRSSDHTLRCSINGGTWTGWVAPSTAWTSGINKFLMGTNNPAGITYVDYIAENPYSEGWSFSDRFEKYTDGDLNGQGGWSGNATFDVQGTSPGTTTYEGVKAVYWSGSVVDVTISKSGSSTADGNVIWYVRPNATNTRASFILYEEATSTVNYIFYNDNTIFIEYSGGSAVISASYTANVWHSCEIAWRSSDKKFRARFDAGTWSDWVAPLNNWTTGIDKFLINTQNPAGAFYVDYILVSTTSIAVAVELQMEVIIIE